MALRLEKQRVDPSHPLEADLERAGHQAAMGLVHRRLGQGRIAAVKGDVGTDRVGEHIADVVGVLLDQVEARMGLGEGVVPKAAGEAQLSDGPLVERKAGEVAVLFRPASPSLQHHLGLAEAVAVGEGRAQPQLRHDVVGPGGVAALGDGDGPLARRRPRGR